MKKHYSTPTSECLNVAFKAAICQMSKVGIEGTEDIELED